MSSLDCEAGTGALGMNDCVRCMRLTELLAESLAILMVPMEEIPKIEHHIYGEIARLPACTCPAQAVVPAEERPF